MSRTDKDRPYWVRLNDYTVEVKYKHDHLKFDTFKRIYSFGKPITMLDYANHCTAFDLVTTRPLFGRYPIIRGDFLRMSNPIPANPCFRYIALYKRAYVWNVRPYMSDIVRPKQRDFLKSQVRRFNSNYATYNDYDFMDEEVFTTRFGVSGKGF